METGAGQLMLQACHDLSTLFDHDNLVLTG
jgi:hypothetical protein